MTSNIDFEGSTFDDAFVWDVLSDDLDHFDNQFHFTNTLASFELPDKSYIGSNVNKKAFKQKPVKSSSTSIVKKTTKKQTVESSSQLENVEFKFFAFPSFDKSDAMIYLPSSLARLSNSGEMEGYARLLKNHCAKDCEMILGKYKTISLSMMSYVGLIGIAGMMFPDIFSCMHSTKVVGNEIQAELYYKYTDTPEMYLYANTIEGVSTDPLYTMAFVGDRGDLLSRNLQLEHHPQDKIAPIRELINLCEEVQVYGKDTLTLTFNPYTKKITSFKSVNTVLSVNHGGVLYNIAA